MTMTKDRAEELAALLPEGLSCDDARERLLSVAEVLRLLSDADHLLSNADIRAVLAARFPGARRPAENTVGDDVRALAASGALGLAVHVTPRGAWAESTALGTGDVRLLLNAVQSSRFLTAGQSAGLQDALGGLVSRYQEDELLGDVHVDQRVGGDYLREVLAACDVVAEALRRGRKVEFSYTYTGFDRRRHALAGEDGSLVRVETPVALYFSEGNYYAETWSETPWRHGAHLMRSRVDRMVDVRVSGEPASRSREVYDARRSAARRMREGFEMVDGRRRRLFLRVRGDATNVMYDRFGFGLRFDQFEGDVGSPDATGLCLVSVAESFTFFRWLSAGREGIVMVEPPQELALRSGAWKAQLKGVTREELVADYHAMVEAYLGYLDRARSPYG